jgi:hypothetical protein
MNPRPDIGRGAAITLPLIPFAWRIATWRMSLRLPAAWRRTPRRRRFLFLGLCTPGFLGVAALPLHHNLWLLLLGLAAMGLAAGFRALSEPIFLTTGDGNGRVQDPRA